MKSFETLKLDLSVHVDVAVASSDSSRLWWVAQLLTLRLSLNVDIYVDVDTDVELFCYADIHFDVDVDVEEHVLYVDETRSCDINLSVDVNVDVVVEF